MVFENSLIDMKYVYYCFMIIFVFHFALFYSPAIVEGQSMEPTFQNNDLLLINNYEDPEVGDVIVYEHPNMNNKFIVHRIVEKKENGYITKGDNNLYRDRFLVKEEHIIGKVSLSIETPKEIKRFIN